MPTSSPAQSFRARGLQWFEDVLRAVPSALAGVPPAGRSAFALWAAERAWRTAPPVLSGVAVSVDWPFHLDAMWRSVELGNRDAGSKVDAMLGMVERALAADDDSAMAALDQDAVAACIYAAECYATGEAEPARWAATRWLDAVFAHLGSEGSLEEDAARPEVQQALGEVQAAIAYVQQPGARLAALHTLRP